MDELDPVELELAEEAIDDFCRQFGVPGSRLYQAYRDFARHAALPLTFSADLLYRLQERFRRDMRGSALHIPWVAVADLMLSHLCHQVRPEIFRLDEHVQAVLLGELYEDRDRFWSEDGRTSRLQEVADFLIRYAALQLNHPSHYVREAAKAERLNAQTISQPEWVREQLQKTAVSLQPQQDPVATLRLASLVGSFNRAVNLTHSDTDQARQEFNKLQAYTSGQAQLAAGQPATAVAQQFRTTFGSDSDIQIGGQTVPGLRQLTQEPIKPTLPASLGAAFDGDDVTLILHKDTPLPATSDLTLLHSPSSRFSQGLGFLSIQIFQGESRNIHENYQLADILLDEETLYQEDEVAVELTLTAAPDGTVHVQLLHPSGFQRDVSVTMVDPGSLGGPGIMEFGDLLARYAQGVIESSHLATLTAVSNWLSDADSERTFILTGERGIGKTTLAALLAQYFRGDRQPPNDLYALARASTSAVYFCQPSRPETLHPRSFALTIAHQWASRDSHFSYLQSIIDNHEDYEQDELIERLLIKPFRDIDELIYPGSIVFLVDDLEAAAQHPGETTIIDVLLQMIEARLGVRFLLTAQMQPAVRSRLADVAAKIYQLPPHFPPIFNFGPAISAMPDGLPGFSELLPEVDRWLANPEAPQHGGIFPEPYCGKSAAAANLIKLSQGAWAPPPDQVTALTAVRPGFIAAYHLYQSTDPRTMSPRHFIQSVAAQLANKYPAYNEALRQTIEQWQNQQAAQKLQASFRLDDDPPGEDHPYLNVVNQMSVNEAYGRLIIQPWLKLGQTEPVLILIDGLEEMLAYDGDTKIPTLLAQASLPRYLRYFLAAHEDRPLFDIFAKLPIKNFRWEQFEGERPPQTRRLGSTFLADVTISDEAPVQPEQPFTKTWRLRNSGEEQWDTGYTLTFVEGIPMSPTLSQPIPTVRPGEEADISISLTAPAQDGHHHSVWRLRDADGIFFGDHMWVKIVVAESAPPVAETAEYDNFDIHVGRPLPGPDMRYPIQVTVSSSGQSSPQETYSPVAELGYERLARLADLASNPEEAVEIGQKLFNVIMRQPHHEMLRRSLATAREQGKEGLRLRLQLDDPALQSYPWELCHDGRSFIFNNPEQPILLQRAVGVENVQTPPPLPRPVRLLVAIAAPVDLGQADVALQEKIIRTATEELVTSSELDVQIIRHATLGDLQRMIASFQPSIVQFIGHSRSEKEGVLILENESDRSNLVPVAEVTRILAPAPVQCVLLSPIGVGETAVLDLAPQFIRQGISTVLAEQFALPDQPAIAYWSAFYRALLFDRVSFEEAVRNGRHHLTATHREPFWSHIALFETSRIPDLVSKPTAQSDETKSTLPSVSDQIPPFIYGMHDPGKWYELFEENNKTGWVLFHNILNDESANTENQEFVEWANRGFGVMARLVNAPFHFRGEGDGSIPLQDQYRAFSNRCAEFARQSPGCLIWFIGNEMNMSWHWPNKTTGLFNRRRAEPITPELYAECFNLVYRAIKEVQPNAWVIPSGLNPQKRPGSTSGDTIRWFQQMLSLLENLDGIDIHTYLPGTDETDDQSTYGFEEFMEAIPSRLHSLPVFITEATPNKVWPEASDGWMERAYARINAWNQTAGNQKIYGLLPYRWNGIYPDKRDDPWNLSAKQSYLTDLAKALQQNYRWLEDPSSPPTDEIQDSETQEAEGGVTEKDKSDTIIASKSFAALVRLLSRPDVRTAVVSFRTDFETVSYLIDALNDYAHLSDLFRELEVWFDLISREQMRLPEDEKAWENIAINEPELQAKIADIITLAQRQTFAQDNVRWVKQLEEVKDILGTAVHSNDSNALDDGVRLLYRVLLRYPARINAQLVNTASSLRLDKLEQAITTISSSLAEVDESVDFLVEDVKGSESALAGLDERLKALTREHNAWQEIDDEIRRVKAAVSQGHINELEDAWFDLKPMTQAMIDAQSTEEWAINLSKTITELESAIEKRDESQAIQLFTRYQYSVGRRFREVGLELLNLCNELQRVGEQIDLLLRQFNK